MPIRELVCETPSCEISGIRYEWFARTISKPDPNCPKCGQQMQRQISTFNAIWTGTLDKFEQPGHERHQKYGDGHWAWRVKSSRLADGGPEKVLIRTRQDQLEYTKAEGLIMPDDMNPNSIISADGKRLDTVGVGAESWGPVKPKEGLPWLEVD